MGYKVIGLNIDKYLKQLKNIQLTFSLITLCLSSLSYTHYLNLLPNTYKDKIYNK